MEIKDKFGSSWARRLPNTTLLRILQNVGEELESERQYYEILPAAGDDLTFRAFRLTPFNEVKVVILGQDIYHNGAYNGLAFGNGFPENPATKIQPSLRNIMKEVKRCYEDSVIDYSLYSWAENGVLLINTAHTVRKGEAGSHIDIWKEFSNLIINTLNRKDDIVWLLWGAYAHKYEEFIYNPSHHIIKTGHPSPLNRTNPFIGSGCFLECDRILGNNKIIW